MKNPTHFIEVFKADETIKNTCVLPLKTLRITLGWSRMFHIETIAIWKIYPKNKVTILKQERREIDPTNIIKQ